MEAPLRAASLRTNACDSLRLFCMMATDLANVRAFFHLLPIELLSLPVVLVARLAKRTIFGLFRNGN